ncbi:HNH endonuclease [Oenococcus oeni]|uniref:HNH endonuclease n=1 Tax=Oenococcus oeni TaxID=1247 RepID=UPI00050D93C2|nr:HNH endonuclease [Oenococcus oeni]KGH98045.1 restriction endonuclease [Oenococcus oeni IOEB_1491]
MRYKVCHKYGCNNLIPYSQDNPYCNEHSDLYKPFVKPKPTYQRKQSQRQYNRFKRDKEANKFYHTKAWSSLSLAMKQRANYTCECCGRTSTKQGYLVVDHIVPRWIDKRRQLDKDNLWVICKRCHFYKGLLEKKVYQENLFIENIDASKKWNENQCRQWILNEQNS